MKKLVSIFTVVLLCLAIMPTAALYADCFCIVVGRDASPTGYPLVIHNEDDGGRLMVKHGWVPAANWPAGTTLPTTANRAKIPQLPNTYGFWWASVKGGGAGLQNADGFLNENGVSLISNSNASSRMTADIASADGSLFEGGIEYNLRRVVAERATSSRHAAEIIIEMLNTYGYAPSGRAYTVGDFREVWQVQIAMGRRYVAIRVPDDHVLIMPNHYTIHHVTQDYGTKGVSILYPDDLISFAQAQGWFPAASADAEFQFAESYQNGGVNNYDPNQAGVGTYKTAGNTYRHAFAESILVGTNINAPTDPAFHDTWAAGHTFNAIYPIKGKLTFEAIRAAITCHYEGTAMDYGRTLPGNGPHVGGAGRVCNNSTIESKIFQFHPNLALTTVWTASGRPCELPYVPLHPLAARIPEIVELDDPAETLSNHLIHEPERYLYVDNVWQKFREFEYMMDMAYDQNIKEVSTNIALYFAEMQAANAAFIAKGDSALAADFDKAAVNKALSMIQGHIDSKPLFGVPVSATAYVDRLDASQVSVDIIFELPEGKTPDITNLKFGLGGISVGSAYNPSSGLTDLGGGKWKFAVDKASLLGNNVSANADGPYDFVLGGRTTPGSESFTGIAVLLFTDGFAAYSAKYVDWEGKLIQKDAYVKEGEATLPTAPTRTGYTFTGWGEDASDPLNRLFTAEYVINGGGFTSKGGGGCSSGLFALALVGAALLVRKAIRNS
ncbi:MAG: C69 family dipeptidase [Synergistaceae bacterium]|nr:C69 family dipeptidase [Synergistaceae bacterium]